MNYTLSQINPGSLARLSFFALAIIGGIIAILWYLIMVLASLFSGKIAVILMAIVGGLFGAVIMVGLYAVFGAGFAWVYAFLYNILAKKIGGIQIELTEKTK